MTSSLSARQWQRLNVATPVWGSLDALSDERRSDHDRVAAVLIALDEGQPLGDRVRRFAMTFAGISRRVYVVDDRWEIFVAEAVMPGEDVVTHIGEASHPKSR